MSLGTFAWLLATTSTNVKAEIGEFAFGTSLYTHEVCCIDCINNIECVTEDKHTSAATSVDCIQTFESPVFPTLGR